MKTFKVLAYFAVVVLISSFAVNTLGANNGTGYAIGDIADDFTLKNVDGSLVSLSDYDTAKGFIVIFTCNTCPFSVANEDRIIALDVKYKHAGYPVIAINPNNPCLL
ncbi:MAG: redoxin domain-containing protein, partial [Dokdonia sp.]|nr:redoxin domain-containing protein [Dokdonia sp.]